MTSPHGISPQSLVEHALAASMADDCVAIVRDSTSANLRWANNTLTTNGVMHGVHVSIVSFVKQAGGIAVGSVSGSATTQAEVDELVRAPTRPRAPPRPPRTRRSWSPSAPHPTGRTSRPAPASRSTTTSRLLWARRSAGPALRAGCSTASSTMR